MVSSVKSNRKAEDRHIRKLLTRKFTFFTSKFKGAVDERE